MLITNKSLFIRGFLLFVSFLCVLVAIFLPIWGQGRNGLDASDGMFNRLAKGSSYFIPGVQKSLSAFDGKSITVTVKLKASDAPDAKPAAESEKLRKVAAIALVNLTKAGATAEAVESKTTVGGAEVVTSVSLTYTGDLGKILAAALVDSDDLFNDRGQAVLDRYSLTGKDAEKAVVKTWWQVLDGSIKPLQKQKMIKEANMISQVNKRGVEPGYNFYGIHSEKVLDNVLPLAGLLIFYVMYTLWYGYAIFNMFGGIGMGMSKPKVKQEV